MSQVEHLQNLGLPTLLSKNTGQPFPYPPYPPSPFPSPPLPFSSPLSPFPSSPSPPPISLPTAFLTQSPFSSSLPGSPYPCPLNPVGVWESAISSPSGSGRSPAAKRVFVHFEMKLKHFRYRFLVVCPMRSTALDRIYIHFRVSPLSVHPATTAKIVSPVLDRSSPDLEHSFPLTSRRKYF